MAEVSPMRGKRVKKSRCRVQGHGAQLRIGERKGNACCVVLLGEPPDRKAEERRWRKEADD